MKISLKKPELIGVLQTYYKDRYPDVEEVGVRITPSGAYVVEVTIDLPEWEKEKGHGTGGDATPD